jgi:hypothetical protein
MNEERAVELYTRIKNHNISKFDEAKHCSMILRIMSDPNRATMGAFCVEAEIGDHTFYQWLKKNDVFFECYALGKMFARENWEKDGRELRDEVMMTGTSSHKFEYWRMIGWSRFGVGKNSRIRLDLDANATPNEHYSQLLKQASNGDFTAGEIKQLMEAVNVGLNTHQVFMLQKEIDQLKADLATMTENSNGNDRSSAERLKKAD